MTDPSLALLAAAIGIARTDSAVVALFEAAGVEVSVWQTAPPVPAGSEGADGYPYIEIPTIQTLGDEPIDGDQVVEEEGEEVVETVTDDPSECFLTVNVLSRLRADGTGGFPECVAFVGALRKCLGREIVVPGFRVTLGHFRDARHFTESDRITTLSVATFRYLIQPA